jgi:hypothetical protein
MRTTVELVATITIEFSETATAADMIEMRERISRAVQPAIFGRESEKSQRSCGHHYDLHYRDFTHDEE